MLPRLKALTDRELARRTVDIQKAALTALGVARTIATPAVRERFGRQLAEEFDAANVSDLETRAGQGHLDLASDLSRLAALYDKHPQVAQDRVNYVPTDPADARRLADGIRTALAEGVGGDEKTWRDNDARAWTVMKSMYDEVRQAGLWLFRRENGARMFPWLYSANRARPRPPGEPGPRGGTAP